MTLARAQRQLAFLCSFACLLGVALAAATPTFWTVSSQADFLKGDVEDLSIDSDGRMFLGPAASVLGETSAPFLWSIVAPPGGLYVATSPDGKIYSVAADGASKTLFDPDDKYIWALASDPSGTLYA